VHGAALGADELKATKENLGWPQDPWFYVPDAVRALCAGRVAELEGVYADWQKCHDAWAGANPDLAKAYDAAMAKQLPEDLELQLLAGLSGKPNATRRLSGEVIQKIAEILPFVVGGSADLAPSTSTMIKSAEDISAGSFGGRNFHFGVREHAMGSIINGIALYGGFIPFGATFLVFADYMRPPIRLANLMGQQVIYVFTHDSIFVGEDGPTHEPVEQVASLRLIPGMTVMRPADGPEVAASWAYALRHQDGPTALILTRQGLPDIDRDGGFSFDAFAKGAYVVTETSADSPDVVLIGTGSELQLAVAAKVALEEKGVSARVVSMPSRDLYARQDAAFKAALVPAEAKRVVIELGTRFGWGDIVGPDALFVTQDDYGHSAPAGVLAEKLGFTADQVAARVVSWVTGE